VSARTEPFQDWKWSGDRRIQVMCELNRDAADATSARMNLRGFSFTQMARLTSASQAVSTGTGKAAASSMERFLGLNAR
jgi:hypothetical protein